MLEVCDFSSPSRIIEFRVFSYSVLNYRQSPSYEISLCNFKNVKKKKMKRSSNFRLREWNRNQIKVTEEYCWAITQAAGRSCYDRSDSRVCWSLNFNWTPLCVCVCMCMCVYVYIYIYIYMYEYRWTYTHTHTYILSSDLWRTFPNVPVAHFGECLY